MKINWVCFKKIDYSVKIEDCEVVFTNTYKKKDEPAIIINFGASKICTQNKLDSFLIHNINGLDTHLKYCTNVTCFTKYPHQYKNNIPPRLLKKNDVLSLIIRNPTRFPIFYFHVVTYSIVKRNCNKNVNYDIDYCIHWIIKNISYLKVITQNQNIPIYIYHGSDPTHIMNRFEALSFTTYPKTINQPFKLYWDISRHMNKRIYSHHLCSELNNSWY